MSSLAIASCLLLFLLVPNTSYGNRLRSELTSSQLQARESATFSGRIIRVNEEAGLLKVEVNFENAKFLTRRDQVEFWHEHNAQRRCRAVLAGKSPGIFLFRIPDFEFCQRAVPLNWGSYMVFYSEDLSNNLEMGRELVDILLTKRLALKGQLNSRKRELETHMDRVNAVNERFSALREKLETEWRAELAALESDRASNVRDYEHLVTRLGEIRFKLERYRINDQNLTEDRWSLDPRLYYKK